MSASVVREFARRAMRIFEVLSMAYFVAYVNWNKLATEMNAVGVSLNTTNEVAHALEVQNNKDVSVRPATTKFNKEEFIARCMKAKTEKVAIANFPEKIDKQLVAVFNSSGVKGVKYDADGMLMKPSAVPVNSYNAQTKTMEVLKK